MLKNIFKNFTNKQLSYFFQIAIIINFIGLLLDMIVYRYFPDSKVLKLLCINLGNLSIIIVCIIIISQSLLIFINNHKKLTARYKLAAITIEILIGMLFAWILTTDNNIQEAFVIFLSDVSRSNHSNEIIILLMILFITLIVNLYQSFTQQDKINETSIRIMVQSVFRLIIKEYVVIFIILFGMIHFTKLHKFSLALIDDTKSSLFFNINILEVLLPTAWIGMIIYYLYFNYYIKKN